MGDVGRRRWPIGRTAAVLIVSSVMPLWLSVTPAAQSQSSRGGPASAALNAERASRGFTLFFFNRPIVVLRARVVGREPVERAVGAGRLLHDLVAQRATGAVTTQSFEGGTIINIGSRGVLLLTPADVDELAGETLEEVTARTVTNLRRAIAEAEEAHTPRRLVGEAARASLAIAAAALALWLLAHARRRIGAALAAVAERKIALVDTAGLGALRAARLLDMERYVLTGAMTGIDLVVVYGAMTFVLRQFPYTRAWGESMSGFLLMTVERLGLNAIHALPGLFTVGFIFLVTRFVVRAAASSSSACTWRHGASYPMVTDVGVYTPSSSLSRE